MPAKRTLIDAACLAMLGAAFLWPALTVSAQQASIEFENVKEGVKYVGVEQCVRCHRDQHASYSQTTHSIATAETKADELQPADFKHPLLDVRYQVDQKDNRMVHREIVLDQQGGEIATTEQPIAYTIGSGAHAKSYLFREGDFFGQSPLTWYAETGEIGMSPGYEGPFQHSFRRKISFECVFCHVGNIDPEQRNPYKFSIVESAIGCERCHGPGELHVKRYRDNPDATGQDTTIVNPLALSRELAEAICQQCHLQGANWITTTGHQMWDFRPGQPITDVRVDYQLTLGGGGMQIVGHVEQMHASECYQQTKTLTCTTCHPPHNPVAAEDRVDFYRDVCLDCHQDQSCGKPAGERLRIANNDCGQCHMPKGETNVTHAAFHNHRIGVHGQDEPAGMQMQAQFVPVLDVSSLSARERARCLAIVKVLQLRDYPNNPGFFHFGREATESLIKLKNTGPVDAMLDTQLALLAIAQNQTGIGRGLATQALIKEPHPTLARIEATELLARLAYQDGQLAPAAQYYRQLTSYRRDANDHYLLGLCEVNLGNDAAAISALQSSLQIDPLLPGPHSALQTIYTESDQSEQAQRHAEAARRVKQHAERLQALGRQSD